MATRFTSMLVHVFRSFDEQLGYSLDEDGSNLPEGLGPWFYIDSVDTAKKKARELGLPIDEALMILERAGFYISGMC